MTWVMQSKANRLFEMVRQITIRGHAITCELVNKGGVHAHSSQAAENVVVDRVVASSLSLTVNVTHREHVQLSDIYVGENRGKH
mmetsp:Transcript_8675/g.11310  ORF Transcript_8675/g.11310 Transcript_8675/m.11310 type:complete len:84 (-) Transcript_8675:220-471(-)